MSDTTRRFQCRHIFTDGRRCGSACLRQEEFCYYHHTTRRPVESLRRRRSRQAQFDLALPEDRSAIQSSIGEVLRRIASNEIDSKRAGLLLYGLQIASLNLPRPAAPARVATRSRYAGRSHDAEDLSETTSVEEIVIDPKLGTIAPRAELVEAGQRLTVVGKLLQRLTSDDYNNDDEDPEDDEVELQAAGAGSGTPDAPHPALEDVGEAPQDTNQADAILPTIQASEGPKQAAKVPKSVASRPRIPLRRRTNAATAKKSAQKLTRDQGIAIVRGFREYPDRAIRETRCVEGRRKAQAN